MTFPSGKALFDSEDHTSSLHHIKSQNERLTFRLHDTLISCIHRNVLSVEQLKRSQLMDSLTNEISSPDLLTALNAVESCQELLKIEGALEILDALGVFVAFPDVLSREPKDAYLVQSAIVKFFSAVALSMVC